MTTPSLATGHAIDLPRLLETRLLVQANSGGGKSWALRRLLEQTANRVQQLVIDPEGEFATLREKFDYVVCAARDGDAVAHPRTAKLLALRLLETGVSAILDIYDLQPNDRKAFVRIFCDTIVNAPKALWHPAMIVLDEAHVFAPEAGQSESLSAVIDLASRGRKRGYCLVAATQRLSKLHKDVAAEMNNKMIGRTALDVDVRRAADELGMTKAEAMASLRALEDGEWFVFGPALSKAIAKLKVGDVVTTHPKAGQRLLTAPPEPSAKVRKALAELADLPQQAEQEARTMDDLRRQLADATRKLRAAEKPLPATAAAPGPKVDVRPYEKKIARLSAAVETLMKFIVEINARDFTAKADVDEAAMTAAIKSAIDKATAMIEQRLDIRNREVAALQKEGRRIAERITKLVENDDISVAVSVKHNKPFTVDAAPRSAPAPRRQAAPPQSDAGLPPARQKILNQLAWLETHDIYPAPKDTLAAVCEVSPTSGGYFNNLGALRSAGLIDYPQAGTVAFTDAGRAAAAIVDDDRPVHERWMSIVPPAQQKILQALLEVHPEAISKDELAGQVGVSSTSGGYFNNLGRLRTLGAIDYPTKGMVALTRCVMPH